jgi:hypothetical protein
MHGKNNRLSKIDDLNTEDYIKFLDYREKHPSVFINVALADGHTHLNSSSYYYNYVNDTGERIYFTYSLDRFTEEMNKIFNKNNKKEYIDFINTHKYFHEDENSDSLSAEFMWHFMCKYKDDELYKKVEDDYTKVIEKEHRKWKISKILDEEDGREE